MAHDDQDSASGKTSSSTSNRSNSTREGRVELPLHMRNRFLYETSHLPVKVFRHLQSYIIPSASRSPSLPKKSPAKKPIRSNPTPANPINTAAMDLGPDLYTQAEILEARQEHDPQRESSSAAASRAKAKLQHSSSSGSSSRCSEQLAQSSSSEVDAADSIHADPVYKANATTAVCKLHEFTYSSQWTRPATELLREILEVRYPLKNGNQARAPEIHIESESDDEEDPLLGIARRRTQVRCDGWVPKLSRVFPRT